MQRALVVLALAAGAVALATKGTVMELNPDNFDSMVRNGEPWMVSFQAPWCGACKALKPHYTEAAKKAKGKANFAVVDATKYRSLSMRFGVNGFPTLYFITNGTEVRKVTASHSSDALVFYATKGWQQAAAVPETTSPLGAYGAVKFYTLFYAEKLLSLHEPLAERWGIPSAVVLFGIMFVFVMGVTGGLILCAVWIGPSKPKAGGARGGSGRGAAPAAAVAAAPAGGAAAGDKKTQ